MYEGEEMNTTPADKESEGKVSSIERRLLIDKKAVMSELESFTPEELIVFIEAGKVGNGDIPLETLIESAKKRVIPPAEDLIKSILESLQTDNDFEIKLKQIAEFKRGLENKEK